MMKTKLLLASGLVASLYATGSMGAPLYVTFDDGLGNTLSVTDGGAGDLNPNAGKVTVISTVGAFSIDGTIATSNSPSGNPGIISLTNLNASGSGVLTITAHDDDFDYSGDADVTLDASQTNLGNESISYSGRITGSDLGEINVALDSPLVGNTADEKTVSGTILGPYTAFLQAVITRSASVTTDTQFNASLTVVPVPAAGLLLLGAIGGLGFVSRKRKAA